MKVTWQKAWGNVRFKSFLLSNIALWLLLISQLDRFFAFIQHRNGSVLQDFILSNIPSYNLSIPIFLLLYGLAFLYFLRILKKPILLLQFVWAYFFIMILRIICMYFVPLEPPIGLIDLIDPLAKYFYGGIVITKDLFFSGHTATCLLIYFLLPSAKDKILALWASIAIVIMLLIQHIHYTIDILAAIIITFFMAHIVKRWLNEKILPCIS